MVVSYIDTAHTFLYSFDQTQMNPDGLVGQSVTDFRDQDEIGRLDQLMTHDDILMFAPINSVEGWVGIPINFRVHRNGVTLGYIASLIQFKSIMTSLYNSGMSQDFVFQFSVEDVEFDREAVHDGSEIYNENRDREYHGNFQVDTSSYVSSTIPLFGERLTISTAAKQVNEVNSEQYFLAFFLLMFMVFTVFVTWQYGKQRNLVDEAHVTNALLQKRRDQIETQKEQLEKLNSTKDRFFSIIGHDLRGPLGSISGLMEHIQEEEVINPKLDVLISKLRRTTASTLSLLNNLLRWSMSQTGDIPFKPFPLNLYTSVNEAISHVSSLAEEKSITIKTDIDIELYTVGDNNMLNLIFRNLLTNAIKFTPQNGNIQVTSHSTEGDVQIHVKDTGVGMTQGQLDALFDLSSHESRVGTRGERGTGLGLIICKSFVDAHEGSIDVESEPESGTTFKVTLARHYK